MECIKGAGQVCQGKLKECLEAELQRLLIICNATRMDTSYKNVIFEGDSKQLYDLGTCKKKIFRLHNWIREIVLENNS